MAEFEVGDRVRRTKARLHKEVGEVAETSGAYVYVDWPGLDGSPWRGCYGREKLEHVADDLHWQELDDPAPADVPVRAQILREAETVITKNRQDQYGNAEDCFGDIAALWTTYFRRTFTAHDVAMAMVLMKVARIKANPKHRDSTLDAIGYLALADEMES